MGTSDNLGKNKIILSHFFLDIAREATEFPLSLLPVTCVIQIVGAEDKTAKFI